MDRTKLDQLTCKTISFFSGNPAQVQHFLKVHAFAALIGRLEGLPEEKQQILEAAAIVHDVGIPPAMQKYGSCNGPLQEQEGPPVARELLSASQFSETVIERVAYLVGHHHTYTGIDGADYQILVEADFLVNLHEGGTPKEQVQHTLDTIFRTDAGKTLLREMFAL